MIRLLHLSDPHFGTELPHAVRAVQRLAADCRPDLVVLTGDVTQRARRAQFDAARAFVAALPAPCVALPGNHDVPLFDLLTRLRDPYRGYRRVFGAPRDAVLERPDLLLLTVRTTRRWRHKHGEVSPRQIERTAERLAAARPEQLRVVAMHQPMHVPRPEDEHNLLRGAGFAARAWARAGADLVLGGHIHLPYVLPMSQRHAGLARELWCVQAGTAVSSRVRFEAPNSCNLIEWEAAASLCRIVRWDFDGDAAFVPVQEHLLHPAR